MFFEDSMAVRIDIIELKENKRASAVKCEGTLSSELGEVLVEMYPSLLETGTPLNKISKILWGKGC